MTLTHILALVSVTAFWGVNFVVAKLAFYDMPPLLFSALRFFFVAFPAIFFFRRPALPWATMALIALTLFVAQFAFMFVGLAMGMPAGMTSVVLQTQAFFTMILGALFFQDRARPLQWASVLMAFAGVALIGGGLVETPALAFAFVLLGALGWSMGNLFMRRAAQRMVDQSSMLGLIVWLSVIPPLPFLLLSFLFEGPAAMAASLEGLTWTVVGAVFFMAYVCTIYGYGVWGAMLRLFPATKIAPFSLLVPVFGLTAAALFLGEAVNAAKAWGAGLVMAGLAVNVWGDKVWALIAARGAMR